MRKLLTQALLCLPFLATGQTYFYINSISVDPPMPTVNDVVTITLHGDLSSTGAYIASASASIVGTEVLVDITAADPGGFTVLVPHDVDLVLGSPQAGTYTIVMNNTVGVWDMASQPQHVFTVSGSTAVRRVEQADGIHVALADGQLSVTATDGTALGSLAVFDASGRNVVSTRTTTSFFRTAIGDKAAGIYLLHLPERNVVLRVAGL